MVDYHPRKAKEATRVFPKMRHAAFAKGLLRIFETDQAHSLIRFFLTLFCIFLAKGSHLIKRVALRTLKRRFEKYHSDECALRYSFVFVLQPSINIIKQLRISSM